jgi:hypothetical protein
MLGKEICDILSDHGVRITVPNLYQTLCDWGYISRKNVVRRYECKHESLNPGVTIVTDGGVPYERPDFSPEIANEIICRFSERHQEVSYSDRDMEVVRRIIDDDKIIIVARDSAVLKYLRGDFRRYYNTSIHQYYLNSRRWKIKRQKVFAELGEVCYKCGSIVNIQVHHLTYMNWLEELSEQLIPLCPACHTWIHDTWDNVPNYSPYNKIFTDSLRKIKKQIKNISLAKDMDDLLDNLKLD